MGSCRVRTILVCGQLSLAIHLCVGEMIAGDGEETSSSA